MAGERTRGDGEILEELETDINVPWIYRWSRITHYYGDAVRELLIACAILMLVTAPFYSDNIKLELPFIVVGALLLVCVAAFTSPWKQGAIGADVVAAGVGLVIFQTWALWGYESDPLHQFVLRECIAILFLFALYFSTKTLRSMVTNQIGQPDNSGEFVIVPHMTQTQKDEMNWKRQAREALDDLNEHEKMDFND